MMRGLWRLLVARLRTQPDAAWKPTGYRYVYRGYNEGQAVEAKQRADQFELRRRRLARQRGESR